MTAIRDQPIAVLSALSVAGGVIGFTKAGSMPSLAAGVGIGGLMAISSMRIHDGLSGGLELAAASSAVMLFPMLGRAFRTRGIVPIIMSSLAATSTVYYTREVWDEYSHEHRGVPRKPGPKAESPVLK